MEIAVNTDLDKQLTNIKELIKTMDILDNKVDKLKFIDVDELSTLTGWSKRTVQDLFNKPDFPSCDFGKEKKAEIHAVMKYFSVPRRKEK